MKKKIYRIPILLLIVSLIILFRPAGKITFDKSVSENRILFQYEIFGCGSLIGKVLDGGEEITAKYKNEYPQIGTNEIVFTEDSDEPRKHMDVADFFVGGLAGRYTYIIEGKGVGVTSGAPECCDPKPAYNENVVEFRVDKWYFTSYVPYAAIGDIAIILIAFRLGVVSIIWIVILLIIKVCRWLRKKFSRIRKQEKEQNNEPIG